MTRACQISFVNGTFGFVNGETMHLCANYCKFIRLKLLAMTTTTQHTCQVSGKTMPTGDLVPLSALQETVLQLLLQDHPDMDIKGYVSKDLANQYRYRQVEQLLKDENGELRLIDQEVLKKLRASELFSHNIEDDVAVKLTFGQKIADHIAEFGGSWTFILSFLGFLVVWIFINAFILVTQPFDPYPFILLNLILSCVAALQAPVIMMSQNRQEAKDRLRSEHDYQINLKAELEIQQLHQKVDHLILKQGQRLMEIQEVQVALIQQILEQMPKGKQ